MLNKSLLHVVLAASIDRYVVSFAAIMAVLNFPGGDEVKARDAMVYVRRVHRCWRCGGMGE